MMPGFDFRKSNGSAITRMAAIRGEVAMTTGAGTLPRTMLSPETGEMLIRGVRPFTVAYKGRNVIVDLPGYYPLGDGDGVHVGDDMSVVDRAIQSLAVAAGGHVRDD
jgi:HTH-type transcriptional regulator/antitoxin MqsA